MAEHVARLADPDYQDRVWIRQEYPTSEYYDDLSMTFEALEDLGALADPVGGIGSYLGTPAEAGALAELGACLYRLFEQYGTDLPDARYLATPEWAQVVRLASRASRLLTRDEQDR